MAIIVTVVVCCSMITPTGSGRCDGIVTGGLDEPKSGNSLGPNLLVNGDLRSGLQGWMFKPSCFGLEGSGDTASLRLQNSCVAPQWQKIAMNALKCPPGLYTISAEIKTQTSMTVPKRPGGTQIRLQATPAKEWARTQPIVGTTDWTTVVKEHGEVAAGSIGLFFAESVGPVAGTSWFRKFSLRRELPPPLEIFLLYPNYRGMMFSDQSQVARVAIDVNPPAEITPEQLHVVLEVTDAGGKVLLTHRLSPPADGSTVATIDMGSLPLGRYRLQGYLESSGNKRIFTQSSYTIVKVSSETRASMKAWIDSDNIIHMGGRPRFVIGLYDTTGFAFRPDYYTPRLKEIAKAPINLMINYFLSNGRADAIYPYTEAMEPFGIFYLATVNALFPENRWYPRWAQAGSVGPDQVITQYAKALAGDSRVVGYYTCDECASERQPRTFHQYGLIKQHDPASITFAVENYPNEFQLWRDTVDVLGLDPYVIGNYRHPESYLGDMTRKVIGAVHGARPVWTVIQFFQLTSKTAWPTEQQLHDLSWMAIVEGATGLLYWSYGARALSWVKDPVQHAALYQELINVTRGISALEPMLLTPDSPVLSANSASGIVITKEKDLKDGSRYLISYNHSGDSVEASFTLQRPAHAVSVYGENRSIAVDHGGSRFKDAYAPFQAHVYKLN